MDLPTGRFIGNRGENELPNTVAENAISGTKTRKNITDDALADNPTSLLPASAY